MGIFRKLRMLEAPVEPVEVVRADIAREKLKKCVEDYQQVASDVRIELARATLKRYIGNKVVKSGKSGIKPSNGI